MKISKALRREAVELAGCRASFWVGPPACHYPARSMFSAGAWRLVDAAFACALTKYVDYGYTHIEAEAQAMLLDGWTT